MKYLSMINWLATIFLFGTEGVWRCSWNYYALFCENHTCSVDGQNCSFCYVWRTWAIQFIRTSQYLWWWTQFHWRTSILFWRSLKPKLIFLLHSEFKRFCQRNLPLPVRFSRYFRQRISYLCARTFFLKALISIKKLLIYKCFC